MSEPHFHIQCARCGGFTVLTDEEADAVLKRMTDEGQEHFICDECKSAKRLAS